LAFGTAFSSNSTATSRRVCLAPCFPPSRCRRSVPSDKPLERQKSVRFILRLAVELLYRCVVPAVSCLPDFRPSRSSRRSRSVLVDAVSWTLPTNAQSPTIPCCLQRSLRKFAFRSMVTGRSRLEFQTADVPVAEISKSATE
jgi:hypothetical protein